VIRAHKIENQISFFNPNDFSCIEYYLSKLKTFGLLLIYFKIDMKDDHCIYVILSNLHSSYYFFVSIFHSTREDLGDSYTTPSLVSLCDYLIREQYNLLHIGVINTTSTCNKSLVSQQKYKYNHTKKQHPHNNMQNMGPKPSQLASTPNGDKGQK
jgi:hypothetical protein